MTNMKCFRAYDFINSVLYFWTERDRYTVLIQTIICSISTKNCQFFSLFLDKDTP